jgi:hypothetical protein
MVKNSISLKIGIRADLVAPYKGLLDELSVYNRALSASEIQAIFNAGSAGKCFAAEDTTPPVVTPPANMTVEATSPSGAAVTYPPAKATDNVGVVSGPTCSPPSGSTFPLGTTTVICTASDAAGNMGSASFTIKVQDTTPPVVTPPANMTVEATGPSGAAVTYPPATATDTVGVVSGPTCSPPSGSTFPLGTTTVTCTAADAAGNTGSASFTI